VRFAEKYNLRKYIRLNHKVLGARWDEEKGEYEVKIQSGDKAIMDWCNILMNGSVLINKWRCRWNCRSIVSIPGTDIVDRA
jgi:hypothetical protein